ncbi:MAG: hypothetical protein JKY88_12685 [Pseudomonadales bacterium]|nr:hypothetical protein [Pseudomonadales bacterium]
MLNRRELLQFSLMGLGLSGLPKAFSAEISAQLQSSDLIYLTPIQTNGKESSCQSEIWYVWDGVDIYVCTKSKSWRAKAPKLGLERTRIWVGDLGIWTKADYKNLPRISAISSISSDPVTHRKVLEMFGEKYPLGWLRWGSVFKKELANGERSLVRYRPLSI